MYGAAGEHVCCTYSLYIDLPHKTVFYVCVLSTCTYAQTYTTCYKADG